jgi:hypothetical protein
MRYQLTPMFHRPYLLNDLSQRLIESHYQDDYGGALRRLNAITEKLESLDFAKTPGYVINARGRLRREVHEGRPLWLESDRRAGEDAPVTARQILCPSTILSLR